MHHEPFIKNSQALTLNEQTMPCRRILLDQREIPPDLRHLYLDPEVICAQKRMDAPPSAKRIPHGLEQTFSV
jgi:hypothetical protein